MSLSPSTKQTENKKIYYSASLMCARLMHLGDDIRILENAGIDELHFDIMDGNFVPNITLGPDFITAAKKISSLPCFAHLMITKPEAYVKRFKEAGADGITVHVESSYHTQRLLTTIRDMGLSVGLAINPATPLTKLDYLLDYVDRVLIMAVEPGFAGQQLIPSAFERVRLLKQTIEARRLPVRIEVDGNITAKNAALFANEGAEIFVLGSSSIFKGGNLKEAFDSFVQDVQLKRATL